ncbi:MAG: lipid A export permease/ATP-binding protein MsbA [Duodenibacillus sp.]|nr:lipid A export permease/ATP-binding protein MsbA [Duodenibacillus sp.]
MLFSKWKPQSDKGVFDILSGSALVRLYGYLKPYKGKIALAVLFMVLAAASSSLIASLLGKLTNLGFYEKQAWVVLMAPLGLIGISVLHGFSMFMINYTLGTISQSVLVTLRQQMFHQMLLWPAALYQEQSTGGISSKFVFEANHMLKKAAKKFIVLVRDSLQVLALTVLLFFNSWSLALVSLVIAPALGYLLRWISLRLKAIIASGQLGFGDMMVRVRETYAAERLIKISDSYDFENRRFSVVNEELRKFMVSMARMISLGMPATQLICMAGTAFVLAVAMVQSQAGMLTLGQFVTFLAALLLLLPPLKRLAGLNGTLITVDIAAKSIFDMLDQPAEPDKGGVKLERCRGAMSFEHVCLRYPTGKRDAVHDFNLRVEPGECIALVGLSGSGKSSLVNMIPRFWNPTSGRILLDGVDTQDLTLASLRRQIAIVSQEVVLFDDTIRANIAYGMPEATEEEIEAAVHAAALTDFIASLPSGLDTPVGEAGDRLSGGQRQRISIARALLKDAPVLILDEATSALDSVSEAQIKEALAALMQGRTTIIVAHRLSTVDHATQVVVMSEGEVVECGTRAELLAQGGLFARLYKLQALPADQEVAA